MQVDDGHGGITTQNVVVTVTGTNDTPVITSSAQIGTITELSNPSQPNPTGSTTLDTATGAVTFTDVDLSDTHTVTVTGVAATGITTGLATNSTVLGWLSLGALTDTTGTGATGSDAWSFSAQDKNFDYLAVGETRDSDLYGAGRRRPWRHHHPERRRHRYRHQRHPGDHQQRADRHDHRTVEPEPAEPDRLDHARYRNAAR